MNITLRLSILLTIITFIVSCQPDDPKIASFDGGDVYQSEYVKLYLESTEYKPDLFPDEQNLEKLVSRIALEKIINLEVKSNKLENDSLFIARFQNVLHKFFFQKYLEKEIANQVISDSLVNKFYEHFSPQYKVSYIQCPLSIKEDNSAKSWEDTIKHIHKTLQSGVSFDVAAKKASKNSNIKTDSFGWIISESVTFPEIKLAIDNLDLNEYSSPIKSDNGFYILYKEDKRDVPVPPFEEVENKIRGLLTKNYKDEVEKLMNNRFTFLKKKYNYTVDDSLIGEIKEKVLTPISASRFTFNFEDLSDEEMDGIVATYKKGVIRVKELFERRHKRPDNMWEFRDRLEIIARLHLFGNHAIDLDYKNIPEFQPMIKQIYDGNLKGILYKYNVEDAVLVESEILKQTDRNSKIKLRREIKAKFEKELMSRYRFSYDTEIFQDVLKEATKQKQIQIAKQIEKKSEKI